MSPEWDRLYDLFGEERATFNRWLYTLVTLVVFLVLVFVPYTRVVRSLDSLEVDLEERSRLLATTESEVRVAAQGIQRAIDFIGDASAYVHLYDEMKGWIDDLDQMSQRFELRQRRLSSLRDSLAPEDRADWPVGGEPSPAVIRELVKLRPEMMAGHADRPCFWKLDHEWIACEIRQAREEIEKRLSRLLYDRTPAHAYTRKLRAAIDENERSFSEGLAAAVGDARLASYTREFLEQEQSIIRAWYEEMAQTRLEMMREARRQKAELETVTQQKAELERRKKEISEVRSLDTPVGELPVGFNDLLVLLPALLLLGGIGLARSQTRLLRLRQSALQLGERFEGVSDPRGHWRLIAPMWLDPFSNALLGGLLFCAFLLPGLIAAGAILELSAPQVDLAFSGHIDSRFNFVTTGAAWVVYGAAILGLALGYLRCRRAAAGELLDGPG